MRNIVTMTATVACALALTACGGSGGGYTTVPPNDCVPSLSTCEGWASRNSAAEGIWSNLDGGTNPNWMQAVILSDGSYWGIVGQANASGNNATFAPGSILRGYVNVNGGSVAGAYMAFSRNPYAGYENDAIIYEGTYSGTVSVKSSFSLTINNPVNAELPIDNGSFNMSYDGIYNQPASLSAITGTYSSVIGAYSNGLQPPSVVYPSSLTVSGSNLALNDAGGNVVMTGTITPHGTTVNVFDISLTTAMDLSSNSTAGLLPVNGHAPAGTIYKGILYQTSSGGLKNYIQIITKSGDIPAQSSDSAFFYMGKPS